MLFLNRSQKFTAAYVIFKLRHTIWESEHVYYVHTCICGFYVCRVVILENNPDPRFERRIFRVLLQSHHSNGGCLRLG